MRAPAAVQHQRVGEVTVNGFVVGPAKHPLSDTTRRDNIREIKYKIVVQAAELYSYIKMLLLVFFLWNRKFGFISDGVMLNSLTSGGKQTK